VPRVPKRQLRSRTPKGTKATAELPAENKGGGFGGQTLCVAIEWGRLLAWHVCFVLKTPVRSIDDGHASRTLGSAWIWPSRERWQSHLPHEAAAREAPKDENSTRTNQVAYCQTNKKQGLNPANPDRRFRTRPETLAPAGQAGEGASCAWLLLN